MILANEFKDTPFKINSATPVFTATDLNHFQGTQTVDQGVEAIVKYASMENNVPTGKFLKDEGQVDW